MGCFSNEAPRIFADFIRDVANGKQDPTAFIHPLFPSEDFTTVRGVRACKARGELRLGNAHSCGPPLCGLSGLWTEIRIRLGADEDGRAVSFRVFEFTSIPPVSLENL